MITAVVLAAGAATRFGSPKQAVLLEPVLERVRASSSIDDVVVVLGAHEVDTDATTVHCPDWERGPGASLRCGLAALGDDVEAAVVVLGDGPDLDPRAIDRVVDAWRRRWRRPRGRHLRRRAPSSASCSAALPGKTCRTRACGACRRELVPCDDLKSPGDVDFADELEGWPPRKEE